MRTVIPLNYILVLLFVKDIIHAIAVLSIITGVDQRLRIGGNVKSEEKGIGCVYDITENRTVLAVFQ